MKKLKLTDSDLRKFDVEQGQLSTRLDRDYQNIGTCYYCISTISTDDIVPQITASHEKKEAS